MSDSNESIKSIIESFYHWEKETPNKIFLRQPKGDTWLNISFQEAGQEARKITHALQQQGLQKGDHVGILSKNCYHWILADLAIMIGGFVSVPYYASLPKAQLKAVIQKSNLKAIFLGKLETWGDKSQAIPKDLLAIKFPHYAGNAKIDLGEDWSELVANNEPVSNGYIPDLEELWTIKFTSGTTGSPKGVMHLHRSPALILHHEQQSKWIGLYQLKDLKCLSYLPLNHVGERIAIEVTCIVLGGTISFGESIDRFAQNLRETQPTLFFAVPRIWNKFYLGIRAKISEKNLNLLFKIPIISGIVKRKIRTAIGMRDVKIAATGAAITPVFLKKFYQSLGIHLIEAYGMTEVCGSFTNSPEPNTPLDSVGKVIPFGDVKIDSKTGEILMKSPYVMKGYYNDPEKTAEVLVNGWIHSGDKGVLDEQGYLKITGRVKDAFKTSKGKYVTPNPFEEVLMTNDFIEQVCVVGIGIPQPLALIVLSEIGLKEDKEKISRSILQVIQQLNQQNANYEKISTAIIMKESWSEQNHHLTPTLKVRRGKIDETFQNDYLYWHESEEQVIWT